jgi:hypothetical protein
MPATAPDRLQVRRRKRLLHNDKSIVSNVCGVGLLACCLALAAADTPQDQLDYLAASLQKGDAAGAISVFDPQMKDFAEIKRELGALATLSGTVCEIEMDRGVATGANGVRLQGEWKLQLNPQQNGPPLIRTERVAVSMQQKEGQWKIVGFTPVRVFARPTPAVFERIASLANSLSENDGPGALSIFSSGIKDYGEISGDLDALTGQTDVLCAIDIVADNETAGIHKLDTDWYLQLKSRADSGPTERRRERVQLQLELIKEKWRITAISPLEILAPIKAN